MTQNSTKELVKQWIAAITKHREDPDYFDRKRDWDTQQEEKRLYRAAMDSEVPKLVRSLVWGTGFTATKSHQRAKEQLDKLRSTNGHFLYLYGPPGTGKTVSACKLLVEVIASPKWQYYGGWFASAIDLAPQASWEEKHLRAKTTAVMVLDDLGQEASYHDRIEAILTARHNDQLLTMCTANVKPKQLGEIYGPRIFQRFQERGLSVKFTEVIRPNIK